MKKTKTPKPYEEPLDNNDTTVSEPQAAYHTTPIPAMLMGMAGRKEYSHLNSDTDAINLIRNGIPRQAMTNLMEAIDITLTEMAGITHTSDRTLRRYKPTQKLPQEQSERLVELARLYSRGAAVFNSMDAFKKWMDTNLVTLGNKKPKEYLDTSLGIRLLMDELGRIEYGVFA